MGQTDLITAQALDLLVVTIWRYTGNNKIPYVFLRTNRTPSCLT